MNKLFEGRSLRPATAVTVATPVFGMNKLLEGRSLRLLAAAIVVINGFFPAVWILLTSLKTEAELVKKPITYLPHELVLSNYVQAFTDQPLLKYLGNSLAVAAVSTTVALIVAAFAAYAIARLNLRHRQLILTCIVASSMFPLVTLLVPIFETMRNLNLLNTYTALVLPYTVLSLPVCTLVLVSFFQSIPKDLENAAMIDGCTRMGALWRVVVPLAAPGVFTAGILAFVNAWDEFLLALSLNASASMRTLPVGISLYQGEFTFPWPVISAALVVAIVPIAVLIAIFQERVVGGLTQGGLKG
ncbi:carbohydrate ABC transporter permease [Polaromonas sp. P1-6]|nr:carbohydrate ABC transporter permease [Polaromonas sp. P1-6]UUZ66794.1 carbohydrate ABC transporter permease [Polaromonas sp. P2-4]